MADLYFCDPGLIDVVSPFKLVGDATGVSPRPVGIGLSVTAELLSAPCTETMNVPGRGTLGLFLGAF
jgi:hypothetical protein